MTLLALTLPSLVFAGSAGTDELLSDIERVPPTVIFVLDLSASMDSPCDGSSSTSCLEDAKDAIDAVARHFDWAHFGVVGTSPTAGDDSYYPIVPVGSSYAELSAKLATVTTHGSTVTTRNLGEVLFDLADTYLNQTSYDDGADTDGDGMTGDWAESPVEYYCSDTYVIVLTMGEPTDDDQVNDNIGNRSTWSRAPVPTDVTCDASGTTGVNPDFWCSYDNIVYHGWSAGDLQTLTGTQSLVVHTVGLGLSSGGLADTLYSNATNGTGGAALYDIANDGDEILGSILNMLGDVQSGVYSRSTPVVSADGAYMIYTWYELTGSNPLPEGHVRAYELDDDPASATYGQVVYGGPTDYGGALWDGGDLLVSRLVLASESNPDDRDGVGQRDIYFFSDDAYAGLASMRTEANTYYHMGFDADFVQAVRTSTTGVTPYLNDTPDPSNMPCGLYSGYDLDGDCMVDADDLQAMVDFVRGLPEAEFRYLDLERGRWKLADSPYATPIVVTARNDIFSTDRSYRAFLDSLEADGVPSVVIVPANDGMLHAFRLEDDPLTIGEDEAGEELWAWIPGYLVQKTRTEEWTSGLIDLMWYGKTFLFDGSPAVEDVWIDNNGDATPDEDEWHRVLVVQQGLGGPVTLALDITDTQSPAFLWEQTNSTDRTAMGYTMGQPVIGNVYDDPHTPGDRWVAMWGGGRAVGFTGSSTAYYRSAEPNFYMWAIGDASNRDYADYFDPNNNGTADLDDDTSDDYVLAGDNIGSKHPDPAGYSSGLNYDSDAAIEYGYVSAALAMVDVDQDGDVDVGYFPVSTSYRPTDEGGGGKSDVQDPGSSWMYKVVLNSADPDDVEWCEFYDPLDGTDGSNGIPGNRRPEVFYAATTSWMDDGALAVYWGTGTPFDRSGTDAGFFFAMRDEDPTDCSSKATPITCDGNAGYFPLPNSGEALTSSPIVYAGVVYFTTYTPNGDQCVNGDGRLYGLYYDDCSGGIDDDGDGTGDSFSTDPVSGYLSQPTVTKMGTVIYGSATPATDGSSAVVETVNAVGTDVLGTRTMAWMEMM
jgi:Neisseria PilC beta-propeller domain